VVEVECQVWGFLFDGFCGYSIVDCDYCDGYKGIFIVDLDITHGIWEASVDALKRREAK